MQKGFKDWKIWVGIAISAAFLYLAFRKVDFVQMGAAFKQAHYIWILPAILVMFISHWFRAWRWQYLLAPMRTIKVAPLFSSLLIGYMVNTFMPAHLGEFVRAYLVGKKEPIKGSSVFGTIVIERIIDVFTLLVLMAVTILVFPFPEWVKNSAYLTFAFIALLLGVLFLMKRHRERSLNLLGKILKPFPAKFSTRIIELTHSFLDGVKGLKNWKHYVIAGILSLAIWFCYALVFEITFRAFDFVSIYNLPWKTSLILLVITTIAVLVPSSPGYVGTYHFLCQISLGFFGVPESEALTYAFVVHGINFLPVLLAGLLFLSIEGMNVKNLQEKADQEKQQELAPLTTSTPT